jgi:hypothetical protein
MCADHSSDCCSAFGLLMESRAHPRTLKAQREERRGEPAVEVGRLARYDALIA